MTERGYLGEVLKELRLERGMSLRALGERAGLSPGYLSALELGRQKNPSLEALCGIAAALGVSITVSCDEPGYIRVSEGSPPCVSVVRSGVPTIREEIEEAKEESSAFNPDWVSAPGDTIADMLEERGITPKELAKRADLSLEYVNRLLKGEAEITLATAIGLEVALGPTEEFWLAREANYRKALRARSEWRRGEVKREWVEEAVIGFKAKMDEWPKGLRQIKWEAAQEEAKTYKPGAEGYQRVYVEVAPCQAVEASTEPVVVGHAIGVDLAGDADEEGVRVSVWQWRNGRWEMAEDGEALLAAAAEAWKRRDPNAGKKRSE